MSALTARWSGGSSSWGLLVHGGAGSVPADRRAAHADGCRRAAAVGADVLRSGGSSLDAVQRAVEALEDDPSFNAGTGACLATDGELYLDAALMRGSDLAAGAVCALPAFRHPIAVARAALDDGAHVLYAAEGAASFAERRGFTRAPPGSMVTEAARAHLARALAEGRAASWAGNTVGAVARDAAGSVAAATSTGGTTAKLPGRVGDSPILGAGTLADDRTGAFSATGPGEGILRVRLASACAAALAAGSALERCLADGLEELSERVGTIGGIIGCTPAGALAFARSTETMSWAAVWAGSDGVGGF